LEPGRVEEKIGEGKTRRDSMTRLTQQDPVENPLIFFLLKRCRFDLKKKRIDPADLVTRSKLGIQALYRADYRAES
jgi:hypothetical protein